MIDLIKDRLEGLGYVIEQRDTLTLRFLLIKEQDFVKAECGGKIPQELDYLIIDWVVAAFLLEKKSAGAITKIGDIDFTETPLKSLTEGDIRVEWGSTGSKSPEERFDDLISELFKSRERLSLFRKMRW